MLLKIRLLVSKVRLGPPEGQGEASLRNLWGFATFLRGRICQQRVILQKRNYKRGNRLPPKTPRGSMKCDQNFHTLIQIIFNKNPKAAFYFICSIFYTIWAILTNFPKISPKKEKKKSIISKFFGHTRSI